MFYGRTNRGRLSLIALLVVLGSAGCAMKPGDTYDRFDAGGTYTGVDPAVSSDGKFVAFSSPFTGRGDIYQLSVRDGALTRLTSTPQVEVSPAYSPKGDRLAFVRQEAGSGLTTRGHLYLLDRATHQVRPLTAGDTEDDCPTFGGRNDQLFFYRTEYGVSGSAGGIYEMSLADGSVRKVVSGDSWDSQIAYSQKRNEIFYTRLYEYRDAEVWAFSLSTREQRLVCKGSSPSVSADGRYLTCLREPYQRTLWIHDLQGGDDAQILSTPPGNNLHHPTWLDARTVLVYDADMRGVGSIKSVSLADRKVGIVLSLDRTANIAASQKH